MNASALNPAGWLLKAGAVCAVCRIALASAFAESIHSIHSIAAPDESSQIPSVFSPAGTPAHSIFGLSMFVLALTGAIFVVVTTLLIFVIVRFRQRPGDDNVEPPQIYGSNQIELSWTVIPVLIVVALFLTTARVILGIEHHQKPATAIDVVAVGHQFWWEFRYPKLGIVTANELHVPVSGLKNPAPTYLQLSSADTDHSFWVPRLAGKTDLIPNRVNNMWIDPEKPGIYLGQCAQYCGTQHAKMLLRVYAQTPEDFNAWVAKQQQPADSDPAAAEGRATFERNACINCHAVAGTVAKGRFGPDLTHLMSRDTIASGAVPNNPENLKLWIKNPDTFKPGSLMPAMKLTDHDLDAVTAYLATLH